MQCAGRPCSPGAPSGPGGEVMARRGLPVPRGCVGAGCGADIPSPGRWRTARGRGDARYVGYVLGDGRCDVRWHVVARGGEVMADRGDAVRCALAAGLPRRCA